MESYHTLPPIDYPQGVADDLQTYLAAYEEIARNGECPGSTVIALVLDWGDARLIAAEAAATETGAIQRLCAVLFPPRTRTTRLSLARPSLRASVWDKSGGKCWYCGEQTNPFRDFSVDHFTPQRHGGSDDLDNLVPACLPCNTAKRDRSIEEFRAVLGRRDGIAYVLAFEREGWA